MRRNVQIPDELWELVHKLGGRRTSEIVVRALRTVALAQRHARGRDVWAWLEEAIEMRASLRADAAIGSLVHTGDLSRMTLPERARLAPDETRRAMGKALTAAHGNRSAAAGALGATREQWHRAKRYLPGACL